MGVSEKHVKVKGQNGYSKSFSLKVEIYSTIYYSHYCMEVQQTTMSLPIHVVLYWAVTILDSNLLLAAVVTLHHLARQTGCN